MDWTNKSTRKRELLDEMELVVPWAALVAPIELQSPRTKTSRPPFPIETMLHLQFMQDWITFGDLAMVAALNNDLLYRDFARLNVDGDRLPDAITIRRFRHLQKRHGVAKQMFATVNDVLTADGLVVKTETAVNTTIINAPRSTKNLSSERDPDMHQTKKGQQWYFGMKAHMGTNLETGVVHSLAATPANAADVGYQGAAQRTRAKVRWHNATRPDKRRALNTCTEKGRPINELERVTAHIRTKGERAFRAIKSQLSLTKMGYPGQAKNTAELHSPPMRGNL